VRVSGGRSIDPAAFRVITDRQILDRVSPAARGKLLQLDLAQQGITEIGSVQARGFGFNRLPSDLELFFNDEPMPLPRWPKEGFMLAGQVIDTGSKHGNPEQRGATFTSLDERMKRWNNARDALCFGYWLHDWAPATHTVESFDTEAGRIRFGCTSTYGVKEGKRFYVFNLLEEISNPGEWYVDRDTGILYFLPPDDIADALITVSVMEEPLVSLDETSHITFDGIIFECTRGTGVVVKGGTGNLITGCTFRNIGKNAASISGTNNGVQNCHVYQTGQGGFSVSGGDRRSLTPANNFAVNNRIHHFNRVCRAYVPGVNVSGVGNRVAHNLIYDAPHFAIYYFGNNHVIEYNELCDVGVEADDAGAIYNGRNPSERGNIIRHNFFHHIGSPLNWGTSGIYPDDGAGGLEIYGNVFYRVGNRGQVGMGGIFINGGKDAVIDNNIFIECPQAVGVLVWPQDEWEHFISKTDPKIDYVRKRLYEEVDITKPPFTTRYPELADLKSKASRNIIRRNIVCRCKSFVMGIDRQDVHENWLTDDDPGFEDASRMNFSLRNDAPAFDYIPGFEAIPFEKIGLQNSADDIPSPRSRVDASFIGASQLTSALAQEHVTGKLLLRIENRTDTRASGEFRLSCNPKGAVRFTGGAKVKYSLDPLGVGEHAIDIEAVPPKGPDEIYVIALNDEYSYAPFLQLSVQYHHSLPCFGVITTQAEVKNALAAVAPMSVHTGDGVSAAEVRIAMSGRFLSVHAAVCDHRAQSASGSWRTGGDIWLEPMFGLFADAAEPEMIRQLVFFPDGSGTGEVWYYHDTRQLDAPEIRWQATQRAKCGYELAALVPLDALGLAPQTAQFRMQAMVGTKRSPDADARVVPLIGSTVSYNDSSRFCMMSVE